MHTSHAFLRQWAIQLYAFRARTHSCATLSSWVRGGDVGDSMLVGITTYCRLNRCRTLSILGEKNYEVAK